MPIPEAIMLLAGALILGSLLLPLAEKLRLPYTALLFVSGFVGSELIVAAGGDIGIRWYHVSDIVFYVLIPPLVFASAYRIDTKALRGLFVLILGLAIPAAIAGSVAVGFIVYYAIDHASGFPLGVALLVGAIVLPTDPGQIVALMKHRPGLQSAALVLEGESLFSDATAIVMFGMLLGLALMREAVPPPAQIGTSLFLVLVGGIGVGIGCGIALNCANDRLQSLEARALITVSVAYAIFITCEKWFGLSGVVAVVACGLILARGKSASDDVSKALWRVIGHGAEILVFIIAGATFTWALFRDQWLAMLIGIAAVLVARTLLAGATIGLWNLTQPSARRFNLNQCALVIGAGAPGAVSLALALSLPLALEPWYTVQAIAYGVVVFTLLVRTPLLLYASRRAPHFASTNHSRGG